MAKERKYKRVQFDFSEESVKSLDTIVEKTRSVSRAEVVRKALRLYDYSIRRHDEGYRMQFVNKETKDKIEVANLW